MGIDCSEECAVSAVLAVYGTVKTAKTASVYCGLNKSPPLLLFVPDTTSRR